jgi:hypothetical protein
MKTVYDMATGEVIKEYRPDTVSMDGHDYFEPALQLQVAVPERRITGSQLALPHDLATVSVDRFVDGQE